MEVVSEDESFQRGLEEITTTRPINKNKSPYKKKKTEKPPSESVVFLDLNCFLRPFGFVNPSLRRVWFVKDICGIVCAIFTWLLILYAEYVVVFVMLIHESSTFVNFLHGLVFNLFAFLAVASHLRAMFTDPTTPSKASPEVSHAILRYKNINRIIYDNYLYCHKKSNNIFTAYERQYFGAKLTQHTSLLHNLTCRNYYDAFNSNINKCCFSSSISHHHKCCNNNRQRNVYKSFTNKIPRNVAYLTSGLPVYWLRYGSARDICYKQIKIGTYPSCNSCAQNFRSRDGVKNKLVSLPTLRRPRIIPECHHRVKSTVTSSILRPILNKQCKHDKNSGTHEASKKRVHFYDESLHNYNKQTSTFQESRKEHSSTIASNKVIQPLMQRCSPPVLISSASNSCNTGKVDYGDHLNMESCVQFADSIISAVGSDLNTHYRLCQTKYSYSKMVESSHPELFVENRKSETER